MGDATARAYDFVAEIARGGMGRVDLVVRRQGAFARPYAMKRLRREFLDDPDVGAMFVDEARIAGLIRHPNVVSVLDVGEDDDGPYLVMEFIEGVSAFELLAEVARRGMKVPVAVVVEIARQTARGLSAAHELEGPGGTRLHVVHRDISPQNILLGFDGLARVTDFGVAHALERQTTTSEGTLKGKNGYMSPEQLRYEPLDARSDLFAFGIVVHEMLSSRRLYAGGRSDVFGRILRETAPDITTLRPDVPPELAALVSSMLDKSKDARPASAAMVAAALDDVAESLHARDDSVDVAAYLATLFAKQKASQHALLASALERTQQMAMPPMQEPQEPEPALATRIIAGRSAEASGTAHRRARSRGVLVGAAVLTVVLAGVAAAALSGLGRTDPAEPHATVTPPVARVRPADELPAAPTVNTEARPAETPEVSPSATPSPATPPPAAPPPSGTSSRADRGSGSVAGQTPGRPPRSMAPERTGVAGRAWDWEGE